MTVPALSLRALVPLLVLAACDGASEPGGVEGRYGVHSVNGHRPPAAVTSTSGGGTLQVVDASLELDAPDAVVELETRIVGANGAAGAVTSTTYSGTYQVSGGEITFSVFSSSAGQGAGVQAQGVVISPREVAVTMNFAFASSQGFITYPVSLILRR